MIVLRRSDAGRNMARFYALSLQASLFGETLLVRRWGRIGTHGRTRSDWFDAPDSAEVELNRIAKAKAKRGYRLVGPVEELATATLGQDRERGLLKCHHATLYRALQPQSSPPDRCGGNKATSTEC